MSEPFERRKTRLTHFRLSLLPPLALSGGVILVDVLTKIGVRGFTSSIILAPQLSIRATDNTAGPFTIGSRPLVGIISGVVLFLCAVWFLRTTSRSERYGLALLLGGGIANLLERLLFHRVTDIVVIGTSAWNIADGAVIGGGLFLCFTGMLNHRRHRRHHPAA